MPPPAAQRTLVQLPPTVLRRLAALVYESLLVGALLFFGAAVATAVAHGASAAGPGRIATQAFLWILLGAYFVVSWRRGGRTLALKAWQLRVVDAQGAAVSLPRALLRYVVAALVYGAAVVGAVAGYRNGWTFGVWAALVPAALSVAYGFLDEQGRFLHDRLTGTKIVHEKPLVSRG